MKTLQNVQNTDVKNLDIQESRANENHFLEGKKETWSAKGFGIRIEKVVTTRTRRVKKADCDER
jgi:hypothetical protein